MINIQSVLCYTQAAIADEKKQGITFFQIKAYTL